LKDVRKRDFDLAGSDSSLSVLTIIGAGEIKECRQEIKLSRRESLVPVPQIFLISAATLI
jgi:hypothetical protein